MFPGFLPRSLAVALLFFLLAAPTFAAGHDVSAPAAGPTSYYVASPRVATNGDTFLTLWTTTVSNAGTASIVGPFIYGSLADASGRVIAPSFQILPFSAQLVDLTAFGSGYLALWQDGGVLHSSLISGSGVVTTPGLAIPAVTNPLWSADNQFIHAHSNGRTVLFTYHAYVPPYSSETRAQLTSADGTPIGTPIVIGVLGDQTVPTVITAGDDYILIATDDSGTYFTRLDGNGDVVVPRHRIAPTASVYGVVAASSGSEILLATPGSFVALSGDGTVLNTRSVGPDPETVNALVWTGDAYVDIHRRLFDSISSTSQRLDRMGLPLGAPLPLNAAITSAAAHDGVVYAAGKSDDGEIVGFAVTAANTPLNGSGDVLSVTPAVQTAPVLASDGVDFIAGWTEEIARNHAFAVRRVSRAAMPLDGQQTDLGPVDPPSAPNIEAAGPHIARHGVACTGGTCLAVWQDSGTIRGRLMTGAAAASSSFVIAHGEISDQPVVWNGSEFFLAFAAPALSAVTISTAGVVSAPMSLAHEGGIPPEVAWDGKHYLLMFLYDVSHCDCPGSRSVIYFLSFAADRTWLGESAFDANFLDAHLASSDHDFLVTYDYSISSGVQLASRRVVATDGDPKIDPAIPVFQWPRPMASSVTWNGTDYVAAWRYGTGSNWWLSEARITGSAFPARRLTSSGIPDRQVAPAIAANAAGESVIAVSEALTLGETPRLRVYAESEIDALPPPLPAAPSAVYVTGSKSRATVTWQSDGRDVDGFLVEQLFGGYREIFAIASADARSIVVDASSLDIRVRAINASGESEPAAAIINPTRRRAAGR